MSNFLGSLHLEALANDRRFALDLDGIKTKAESEQNGLTAWLSATDVDARGNPRQEMSPKESIEHRFTLQALGEIYEAVVNVVSLGITSGTITGDKLLAFLGKTNLSYDWTIYKVGIEATRTIRRQCPDVRVIALTAYNEKAYQRALREAGADGFVLKTAEFSELLNVIQNVIVNRQDTLVFLPEVNQTDSNNLLTEREVEVLSCAARGWPNKKIGAHLEISDRTVQVHLQAIYQKLNVTNRTEAVLWALRLGIVQTMEGGLE